MTDWDAVYSEVIASTGWTWEYVDEFLTLPRLRAIYAHWRKFPPVHVSVASFLGAARPDDGKPKKIDNVWQGIESVNEERFAELARPRPGVGTLNVKLPR